MEIANNNTEILEALKEFETESTERESQKQIAKKRSGGFRLAKFILKHSGGTIKNEKQISYILLVLAVAVIIVSIVIILTGGSKKPTSGTIPPGQFVPPIGK